MPVDRRDMDVAIEAEGLTKTFRSVRRGPGLRGAVRALIAPELVANTAVAGVSFSVGCGELLALLGPNGAGKSTTIKMLTGILTPTSGYARVAGLVPYQDRERSSANIGAVFGQRTQLWWDLPACQSFRILRDIYGVGRAAYHSRLAELDELLVLSSFWDTRVRHLSLGQRVRCDLAAALLHEPAVIFLDEPTFGMDVVVKEQVRELLRHEVKQRGRTVLLTTHDMTEVERLAERVVLINHGCIVLDGTLAEIRARFGRAWRVHATVSGPDTGPDPGPCPDGLRLLGRDGRRFTFGPEAAGVSPHQALKLIIERYRVTDIQVEESDLEDVMRAAYLHDREAVRLHEERAR